MAPTKTQVTIGRRKLDISNLDKVFYPSTGTTKGDVISYYRAVAPVLLPHLKNRFLKSAQVQANMCEVLSRANSLQVFPRKASSARWMEAEERSEPSAP